MAKLSIKDVDIQGRKVLMRVDFNVPLDEKGNVTDDTRIRAALPTIQYALDKGCKIILMSHLGRPKGNVIPEMSLKPVAARLSEISGIDVIMAPDCIGEEVRKLADGLEAGQILLLENLRFHIEETKNDESFAKELAGLGEIFVQDAFGSVHRAHASTSSVCKYLTGVCGFLLEKEIEYLGKAIENPSKPFLAILGGAKVSDKIGVIENLAGKVDSIIIGGAMAYTFLKAEGIQVGASRVEEDKLDLARELLTKYQGKITILLPSDHLIADKVDENAQTKVVGVEIPDGWLGVDIGPVTVNRFSNMVRNAKMIVWNGPMGIFEMDKFAEGTMKIAHLLADTTDKGAISIIGGGDTVAAINKAGLKNKMSHISTGGGASLEFLEGKALPGIVALKDK